MPNVGSLLQDLHFAARTFGKAPAFASVAVLTLALGIGGNVAIFTLVDAALLRPLPYPQSDRLVEMDDVYQGRPNGVGQSEFKDWTANAPAFERMALVEFDEAIMPATLHTDAERFIGNRVTDGFFDTLGARALYGRTFLPGEDLPGRAGVIVLSHALWMRQFGGDQRVVGTTITLGETPHLVVGVMPPSFFWVESRSAEFWRPLGYVSSGRTQHQYTAVGRLRPDVPLGTAQAQMDTLARQAEQHYADAKGWSIRVTPLGQEERAAARTPLLLLGVSVGLVLLIACANVASLMAVRTSSRSHEIAIRSALGATRARLVRQLLVESGLLSSVGAVLGLLVGYWVLETLPALLSAGMILPRGIGLALRSVVFCAALAALTTGIFGLVAARRAFGADAAGVIKAGSGGTGGAIHRRFLGNMVVTEVALATVLLVAASLLIVSLGRLVSRDLGFRTDRVLTFSLRLPAARYTQPQQAAFLRDLLERVAAMPGVEGAAATTALPMSGVYSGSGYEIEGQPAPAEWRQQSAQSATVTAGYFDAMQMRVLRGRGFTTDEQSTAVAISESLARRHWPNEDPIGRRIRYRRSNVWLPIVAVVSDTRYGGPAREPNPTIYHPMTASSGMFVVVRLGKISTPVLPSIRAAIREMDSSLPVTRVATMDDLIGRSVGLQRLLAWLLGVFAALAAGLAALGTYGVVAYSVQRRTREMGIRLALGADIPRLRNMVLWEGCRLAGAGLVIGVVSALGVTRFISSYLFGVAPRDPVVFTLIPLALGAVALASVWLPARRATRVDPIVALRVE